MPRLYDQPCPVAKSLDVLGERWTLLVVRDLLRGRHRFHELAASLPGIAPNVLSDRLKFLEEHGLVERRFYSEHPPRAEYLLTDKGRELEVPLRALASWGARNLGAETAPVHRSCGHPVELTYRCPHCAEAVERDAVEMRRTAPST